MCYISEDEPCNYSETSRKINSMDTSEKYNKLIEDVEGHIRKGRPRTEYIIPIMENMNIQRI